jgi:putative membrane protein
MLAVAVAAAVGMFFLAGVPSLQTPDPSLWLVAPAAALAVCALVLPGVSGSFLLVILGLYEPTLAAVNDRDVAYLGVFVLGAIVGLALFVRAVQYLLTTFRALTLSLMTGLMAGSLRALWPWQGEERDLIAPGEDAGSVVLATVIAMVFVITLLVAERYLSPRVNSVSQGSSE